MKTGFLKTLSLCFFLFFTHLIFAQKLQLCFKSSDSAYKEKPILLSFNVIDKDWSSAFVQYKNQDGGLLLKFVSEKVIQEVSGRPWQFEYTFNEVLNGKVNGKYVISVQGANVIYFYYSNKAKKNKISFVQDYYVSEKCGCDW